MVLVFFDYLTHIDGWMVLIIKNMCVNIVPCMHARSHSARRLWRTTPPFPKSPKRKHLRHQPNPLWGPQPQLQKITPDRMSVRAQTLSNMQ